MIADPSVSKRKFDKEVELVLANGHWREQGVWILRTEFPIVFVALVSPKLAPWCPGVLAAVHIDFSDFDVCPPSVRFVDPFTEATLMHAELKWHFPRATKLERDPVSNAVSSAEQITCVQTFDSVKPFLCLPGVREYHECSGHSGDSWFMHRQSRAGLLVHLLTVLQRYGPGCFQGVNFNMTPVPMASLTL